MNYENRCAEDRYNKAVGERASDLSKMATEDGVELMWHKRFGEDVPEETRTPALEFGTSVHLGVLMDEEDFVVQRHNGRTKEGKQEKAHAEAQGYRLIKEPEANRIRSFVSKADDMFIQRFGCNAASDPDALVECAVFGSYEDLPLKAKLDYYKNETIIDLKSISRWPHEGAFLRHVDKYGYPLSACHYINVAQQAGLEVKQYLWLFVESVWPFRARWVECPSWMLDNSFPKIEICYQNMLKLEDFVPPTEVELQPESWWLYRNSEEVALEGVESYEE